MKLELTKLTCSRMVIACAAFDSSKACIALITSVDASSMASDSSFPFVACSYLGVTYLASMEDSKHQ